MSDSPARPVVPQDPHGHHAPLWLVVLVAALAVCVLAAGVYAYTLSRAPERRQSALDQLRVDTAQAQVTSTKGSAASHLQLAYAYQRAGNYSRARREYAVVLSADPRNTAAEFNLGQIDELEGDTRAAAKHYRTALSIDQGNELAAKQLAIIEYANQDWKGLLGTLEPAVAASPDMSDLRFLLGVAYEKSGQRKKAIAEYKMALRFTPNLREAKAALARLQ